MKTMLVIACAIALAYVSALPVSAQSLRPANGGAEAGEVSASAPYTFYLFYKASDGPTTALAKELTAFVQASPDRAKFTPVDVSDAQNAAIVKQYDVARAPMPLLLSVAPNGAVTGAIPRKATSEQISQLFITPTMASCMKEMQAGRLAIVCFGLGNEIVASKGAQEFLGNPLYKDRVTVIPCRLDDKAEAEFLKELKVSENGQSVVFAPPGVLVGTFAASAPYSDYAAAMKQAGKCCDDPNCKHASPHVSAAPSSTQGR